MDKITCPTCGFSIAVEREGDELVLTFNIVEWHALCTSQGGGDPALCVNIEQRILTLLPSASGNSNGRTKQT
jgi:hypothetical protein